MLPYQLTERAAKDFQAIREWYDQRDPTLANRFVRDVVSAIKVARERPQSCPVVRRGIRALRCDRFPYRVYFDVIDHQIVVMAIYHTSRKPQL